MRAMLAIVRAGYGEERGRGEVVDRKCYCLTCLSETKAAAVGGGGVGEEGMQLLDLAQ